MTTTKICTKCGIEKSLEEFYKDNHTKCGYSSKCKECASELSKKYREKNREKLNEYLREYHKKNREKAINNSKEYYINNKEKMVEQANSYYHENKEKVLKYKKEYRQTKKEQIYENNKKYNKTEKGRAVQLNCRYKRRTLTKTGDVTSKQLLDLKNNSKHCYWCGCSLKNIKIHFDHYVPVSKGGLHTISNLVVSCQKCNLTKNDKLPHEFALSIGKLL